MAARSRLHAVLVEQSHTDCDADPWPEPGSIFLENDDQDVDDQAPIKDLEARDVQKRPQAKVEWRDQEREPCHTLRESATAETPGHQTGQHQSSRQGNEGEEAQAEEGIVEDPARDPIVIQTTRGGWSDRSSRAVGFRQVLLEYLAEFVVRLLWNAIVGADHD